MRVMREKAGEVHRRPVMGEPRRFHVTDFVMLSRGNGQPLNHFQQICIFERAPWLQFGECIKQLIASQIAMHFSTAVPKHKPFHPALVYVLSQIPPSFKTQLKILKIQRSLAPPLCPGWVAHISTFASSAHWSSFN